MDLYFEKLLNKDISLKILSVYNARYPDNKPAMVPAILAEAPHQSANVATGISIDLLPKRIDLVCDVCLLYSGYKSSCLPHYTAFGPQTDTELFILHALLYILGSSRHTMKYLNAHHAVSFHHVLVSAGISFSFLMWKKSFLYLRANFCRALKCFYKLLPTIPLRLQTIHKKRRTSLLFIRKYKFSVCRDFVFPSSYAPQDLTLCFSRLIATHATCHPLFCYSDPCPATSVPSPMPLNFAVLISPLSNLRLSRASLRKAATRSGSSSA